MRLDRTRTVRRALLALVVLVSAAVAWSLRRGAGPSSAPRPSASGAPAQGTTVSDLSFMRFKEGSREISIRHNKGAMAAEFQGDRLAEYVLGR